ncbi:unnamed protein product [Rodentolepis nana]|uniref:Adiponectin receptor n=1 Tax=Rodentolepis nana TaxID=102285 RepID=A0A3P7RKH5_RODNA|nr:unnamed protein product [Rodentolepis nana]
MHFNSFQDQSEVRFRRPRTLSVTNDIVETRLSPNGVVRDRSRADTSPGFNRNKVDITSFKNTEFEGSFLSKRRRSASYSGSARECIVRNATRAEFMIQLWQQVGRWRVVHYSKLPEWMRDNDFLIWGHRPPLASFRMCFRSIFRIHTETGNIWTHLLGCVCFLVLCISFLSHPELNLPWDEILVISVFFISAILALGFSWIFHTFACHSERIGKLFGKLDYIGIAILEIGSFVPWIHYSFYCHTNVKIIYLCLITILGIITMILSSYDQFSTPNYRGVRAGLFISLGLSAVAPCLHYIYLEGFWESVTSPALGWLGLMAILYIIGALFYATRTPERFFPGKFDIWFQSHQIFHVFVVVAALVHLNSILEIAAYRRSRKDCTFHNVL